MKLIDKLRAYIKAYEQPPFGRAVEGTVELLKESAAELEKQEKLLKEQAEARRWIPCSKRMPEEHDSIFAELKGTSEWDAPVFEKISDDVNITVEFEDGKRATMTAHTVDGKWINSSDRCMKFKVIAWQPLPEAYCGEMEESMGADLISRSKVLDIIRPRLNSSREGTLESQRLYSVLESVKELPAAYDVDKVLGQLEEVREAILTDTAYGNDTVNHYLGYVDLMIEAVKTEKNG